MIRIISILSLLTVLLFAVSTMAQTKVVVIPLNTGKGSPGGVQVVTSATGRVWMDRNLGPKWKTQVAHADCWFLPNQLALRWYWWSASPRCKDGRVPLEFDNKVSQ